MGGPHTVSHTNFDFKTKYFNFICIVLYDNHTTDKTFHRFITLCRSLNTTHDHGDTTSVPNCIGNSHIIAPYNDITLNFIDLKREKD